MKASWYAEALYSALQSSSIKTESDASEVFIRFKKVLAARGHEKLFSLILIEFDKVIAREKAKNEIILVTTDKKNAGKWSHAYDHYEKEGVIPKGTTRRDIVDESIVGGFQIRAKDILVDGSYKKSLVELYRSVIN